MQREMARLRHRQRQLAHHRKRQLNQAAGARLLHAERE